MNDSRMKKYFITSIVFGALAVLCLIALLAVLMAFGWKFLSVKPAWLGFLLLFLSGLFLMLACTFTALRMFASYREETSMVCPTCGTPCSIQDSFCANCGEKLSK